MSDIQRGMSFRTNLHLSCGRGSDVHSEYSRWPEFLSFFIVFPVSSVFYSTVLFNKSKKDFNNEFASDQLFFGLFHSILSFNLVNRMHYLRMFYTLHFGTKTRKYSIFFIEKESEGERVLESRVYITMQVSVLMAAKCTDMRSFT